MSTNSKAASLTDGLPAPDVIRQRLADNLQENRLLRQLLRVAEKVGRESKQPAATEGRGSK